MPSKVRFAFTLAWLFVAQVGVLAIFVLFLLLDAGAAQRALLGDLLERRAPVLAVFALLLLVVLGLGLHALRKAFTLPLGRLAEAAVLMANHPRHRIAPQGARAVRALAAKLNDFAAVHQSLRDEGDARTAAANRALSEERNRLAALMSELALGVVVCSREGNIVLYNQRAMRLLGTRGQGAFGLGRPLSGVLDAGQLGHAFDQVRPQVQSVDPKTEPQPAVFVARLGAGRLVRIQVASVRDSAGGHGGFVLTLDDITHNIEDGERRAHLLQSLGRHTRGALGNLRAAVETMEAFPAMGAQTRDQLSAIINEESGRLAREIDSVEALAVQAQDSRWDLEDLRGADLLSLLRRRMDAPFLRILASGPADTTVWLHVDSFALAHALGHLARHLAFDAGVQELHLGLQRAGRLALLSLSWDDAPLPAETLRGWENETIQASATGSAGSLSAVVALHGGETVYRAGTAHQSSYALLLPIIEARIALEGPCGPPGGAHFYDFDLLNREAHSGELDAPLAQLAYTVFDTETTGLLPGEGDEIIAIGALRIVNGRLLHQECFERLVQPSRGPSDESVAVHGIAAAMLKGQERVGPVLREFERFAKDSVLVAHNAAFDMRFLQLQEAETGVAFRQPVLDTLLLSQVVHPNHEDHSLEGIAARLGVAVEGRHTALGDATVTGAVFLALLPLLAEQGIVTLRQAREASQQTLYSRVRY